MPTRWSTLKPIKKRIPSAHKRGLVLLRARRRSHKWSHFCEPNFPKCFCKQGQMQPRCEPASWTSFLPSSPPVTAARVAGRRVPLATLGQQWVAVAPKGAAPARALRTPTRPWLSPERALSHHHPIGLQGSPVAPKSVFCFPRNLALFWVLLPFPGLCWWLNSPWNRKCHCRYCGFYAKRSFPNFQLVIPVPGLCAHFLLYFQVVIPAGSQAHLWELLI